jgi:hypothetical protein
MRRSVLNRPWRHLRRAALLAPGALVVGPKLHARPQALARPTQRRAFGAARTLTTLGRVGRLSLKRAGQPLRIDDRGGHLVSMRRAIVSVIKPGPCLGRFGGRRRVQHIEFRERCKENWLFVPGIRPHNDSFFDQRASGFRAKPLSF